MAGQLNSKNKRFKMNVVKKGISYDRLENDFLWLKDAGVALPVYNVQEPKLTLKLNENRSLFKLFFSDVGLLTSQYSDYVKMKILNQERIIKNTALYAMYYKMPVMVFRKLIYTIETECGGKRQQNLLTYLYDYVF